MKGGEIMKNFKGILFTLVSVICLLLPTAVQTKIRSNVHFLNDKPENFELVMEEISDSFIFLRYAHERKAVVGNWGGLSAIAEGIMKVSKELVGLR